MLNLREVILMYRVRYYVTGSASTFSKALGCLERYFFLLAFCSYVNDTAASGHDQIFTDWLSARSGKGLSVILL